MLQQIENLIAHLQTLDSEKLKDVPYDNFKTYFHEVLPYTAMTFFTQPERLLFRARPNGENERFVRRSMISYNQEKNIKSFGRANEIGESIFYCSTEQNSAIMEVSQAVNNPDANVTYELITLGVWVHTRPLNLINVPFGEKRKSSILDRAMKEFEKHLSKMPKEDTIVYRKFLYYISREFEKTVLRGNDREYKITAAYANFIYNYEFNNLETKNTSEVDGLLYPSVRMLDALRYGEPDKQDIGANLAIKKKVVDECFVLHNVGIFEVKRIEEKEYRIMPIEIDKTPFDNRIEYEPYFDS